MRCSMGCLCQEVDGGGGGTAGVFARHSRTRSRRATHRGTLRNFIFVSVSDICDVDKDWTFSEESGAGITYTHAVGGAVTEERVTKCVLT